MFKRLAYWVLNLPPVWITFQYFVGANQWKSAMYPSVFHSKGKLLDFGCSMGNNTGDFLDFEYLGVDMDSAMIEAAKKRWASHKNVRFECGDITTMKNIEGQFDHVLFACTGHHLTDEQIPSIMGSLLSALRPDGEIHFFDPLRQPGKDSWITRKIIENDQGKFMRTKEEYERMFTPYKVTEKKVFESPNNFIKLQDMLYMRIKKN